MTEPTICWDCENANALRCPWFKIPPRPVKGWVATPTVVMGAYTNRARGMTSFIVHECPRFKPIPERIGADDD